MRALGGPSTVLRDSGFAYVAPAAQDDSRALPTPNSRHPIQSAPMPDETESGASLLARREYARAVPLLKRDLDKYQSNPRIRLQYADALAGAGEHEEAIAQYEHTAKYYEDNGLTVQAIAVAKKGEKLRDQIAASKPQETTAGKSDPL